MIANQIAQRQGLDAVTDKPLAFALNELHGCASPDSALVEGIIASTIVSFHVPKAIGLISAKQYAELRKSYAGVRQEFATLVRELKDCCGWIG
jgi:hypothetical protein